MGQTVASWAGFGVLFVTLGIVLSPGLANGQAPISPGTSGQTETAPAPGGQPQGTQQPGTQAQPPGQAAPPGTQPPAVSGAQPIDPFAGSPLLQMFEGQPDASAPIRQSRFAPAPALGLPLSVQLFLTAEEEFTDNANQTKDNRNSQFSTRISPGISIGADRPWAKFGLSYAPSIFIENNSIGNTDLNHTLSARAGLLPDGKFQLNIANDFVKSNDFQDQQNPGSRLTGTNNYIENVVTAEAAYVLSRLRTALTYTNVITQTADGGTDDTRISHTGGASAAYTHERFSVGGTYALTRGNENSSIEIPYWSHLGTAQVGYVLTPGITANLNGSYEFQEPDSGAHFSTGRGLVGGTLALGSNGTLSVLGGFSVFSTQGQEAKVRPSGSLAYSQRFAAFAVGARYESLYENNSDALDATGVTFTQSAGIFVTTTELLFRRLTGTAGVRWTQEEFQQTTRLGGSPGTKDQTWGFDVSIGYPLARSLSLDLGYTGTIRTSTESSAEFYENRVRLGLRYAYTLF